ncbi:Bifunctional dethiobiotin synthetase/7,8-diamino-pelargonic acid aminotransferase, mitochondrial [Madurella mycetomatis]|uniref:Bifunctional dethiobiotin synthetase/7,8-diamino-pelargonic acid aminotransferase, mitochondrial n=1 Tax=Madurella mycetomatis TaxID=100816 RepID=A0A175W7V9_9PEZI|nr:Bifunctional dethiobiotin synthetase/7,8-diamino-pelargonic acid aminotransferase, mitochondrial [Madurella mycetomatis]
MTPRPPVGALLRPDSHIFQVFGANTDVGKTICTTALCRTSACNSEGTTRYLKPVSTGPADTADAKCKHVEKYAPGVVGKTLHQYDLPISPHRAAKASSQAIPSDEALLGEIRAFAFDPAAGPGWLFVETAGGVHSPSPSGSTQADLYMPLRLPVILIGDHKLGGISITISAFESLRVRGYDVVAVLLLENKEYLNHEYLAEFFAEHHSVRVGVIPSPPPMDADDNAMEQYYETVAAESGAAHILRLLEEFHDGRIERLQEMSALSCEKIWFPFTQHGTLAPGNVTVIDSAYGDYFQTVEPQPQAFSGRQSFLRSTFDGSASWWTQGLGHSNPRLSIAAAYAAGRYGHVTFAQAVHQPALALAKALLKRLRNPRLARVFFSDNGSTGVEVAVKMALRAACKRYGWGTAKDVEVLGLRGSYHGDTIGAMDCSEPNTFNKKVEWYSPRGVWLEYPTVQCVNGKWTVEIPPAMGVAEPKDLEYPSLSDIFDSDSREPELRTLYERYIADTLDNPDSRGRRFGALIIEPIVLGAGGMVLVDPLFQRTLIEVVRRSDALFSRSEPHPSVHVGNESDWSGLPVIFDEVFTGLYRLGKFSAASFLGVDPDISVHAKLLTGGLLPLAVTLASESIFRSFDGVDKSDALLHGHSYTAHPVGCQVALESVYAMQSMEYSGKWEWACGPDNGWNSTLENHPGARNVHAPTIWSVWNAGFVEWLSRQTTRPSKRVKGAWALGTVLAIQLETEDVTGYESNGAAAIQAALLKVRGGDVAWNVHSRALGNVFYLMAGLTTMKDDIGRLESLLQGFFSSD